MPVAKKVVSTPTPAKKAVATKSADATVPAPSVVATPATVTKKVVKAKAVVPVPATTASTDVVAVTPASPMVTDTAPAVAVTADMSGSPSESSSINDVFNEVLQDLTALTTQCKSLTLRVKVLQKQVAQDQKTMSKKSNKKKNAEGGAKRAPSGFAKPSRITSELAKFLKVDANEKLARTNVTKMITSYVKDHNLQNPANKKIIVPDANLKKLLKNGNEEVTFFNLQKFMKVHYIKDENATPAPSATPVAPATPVTTA